MKGFGKFITFVGITGAALAGLWYFCETNKEKCSCACDGDDEACEKNGSGKERSYVSLDPELKEEVVSEIKEVSGKIEKTAKDAAKAAAEGKDTLKKAVKSAAHDIMTKAEDKARGVGLVKDDKKTSDFEFEDFDKAADKVKEAAKDAADSVASKIDIQ
ncbi:MAG: hypothetical protein K6F87_09250 [Lachnospiraceae bacterium]|nr:hypothetical protein [Lachnospiraceae bacterium]